MLGAKEGSTSLSEGRVTARPGLGKSSVGRGETQGESAGDGDPGSPEGGHRGGSWAS